MSGFSAIITKEDDWYVSWCPELDVASQGKSVEEALENLKEAVELYLEDEDAEIPDMKPLITTLEIKHEKTADSVVS